MKRLVFVCAAALTLAASAEVPYRLGMAGFSFWKTPLEKSLETMKTIDCHYLCVKDFHLPLNADEDRIAAFQAKCKAAGVETRALGPVYFTGWGPSRQLFEQAKKMGVKTVVVVPFELPKGEKDEFSRRVESESALDILEKLVREYDIRAAIHNHGPDMPKLFPTAEAIMARIKNRDHRIGICLDIGHEQRAGLDPVEAIRKFGDRIYDVHLKNIHAADKTGHAVQGPRGVLDIRGVFEALAEVGYDGVCHIEYERDFENNAMGLAESFGFYRGVLTCVQNCVLKK